MDPLYIVELDVTVAKDSDLDPPEIYPRLVDHARKWLSRDIAEDGPDLTVSGQADLPARRGPHEFVRSVRWSVTTTSRLRVLHCSMRQPIEDGHGAQFVCEFTIFQSDEGAALRVELGRESFDGLMSPVSVQFVRRPGLLSSALRDPDLRLSYQHQTVDARYEWINPRQAQIVPEVLAVKKRLPILLVEGGDEHAKELGQAAANQMSGLAQVLLVDRRAQAQIAQYLESIDAPLPSNGARLIWPTLETRHPEFWDLGRTEKIVSTLMKIVAPVSVAARGFNRLRHLAAEDARRERDEAFEKALDEAAASGDAGAEVEVLRTQLRGLQNENEEWVEEVDRLTQANDALAGLEHQLAYWKAEAARAYEAVGGRNAVDWSQAPELEADDLTEFATFLTTASGEAIVFTAAAHRAWRKSGYPHVEAMADSLMRLAQAAAEWRRGGCDTGMRMKEWFKHRFELNYSSEDEPLVLQKKHLFDHDGTTLSREPHLKLDDHVKPNEVGRVYFALDAENARFVVDHVGLKLYGI
ncbi:MAG: hypothetical protein QM638_22345 [Nocardioides sp.]|uniref:hypothetical protein n=1 Tax=Nocardioides sp. TaxID=35761 RepID=UPI0039E3C325